MSATPVDPALTDAREGPGAVRRAYRDTQEPIIGGVARGLATHLGVPVVWVRAAFVLFTALGGMGIALYAGLWMVLPSDSRFFEDAPGLESATRTGKRPGRVRRLTDVGPAIALGATRLRRGHRGGGGAGRRRAVLAAVHRDGRDRAAVAAGRRGPARAVDRHHRPDQPGQGRLRQRRLGVLRPRRRRARC